ncbi:MAG: 8-oxo-dGTP diphosphatase [Candidatus Saccharimonadales bacterium]
MNRETDRTLVFLSRPKKILLGYKKRGHGADLWNGIGGKVEVGESTEAAMIRECQEEIGVTPENYRKIAQLVFRGGSDKSQPINNVTAYLCDKWAGEPTETEEMRPSWFKLHDVPYGQMWSGDGIWLPLALSGSYFEGTIEFDSNDKVKDWRLDQVKKGF